MKKNLEAAFSRSHSETDEFIHHAQAGMTLRDYFAAQAMPICYQYWMGDYYHPDCPDAEDRNSEGRDDFDQGNKNLIAEDAYRIADAMMKAREA